MNLVRYGVVKAVIGEKPILEPLSDGYWTPWYLAEAAIKVYKDRLAKVRQAAGQPDDDGTEEGAWVAIYMEKLRANLQLANTMRVMRKQKTNTLIAAAEKVIAAWDVSQDGDVATHLIHDLRKAVTSIKEKK